MSTVDRAKRLAAARPHRRGVRIFDREAPLGYLLLVPTMAVLGVFLLFPFFYGLVLSVTATEVGDTSLGSFVGSANYLFEVARDGVFKSSFWNTFAYTFWTTIVKFVLGLTMALLLNQVFPAQRFVRAALLLPWIIPSVLSTLAWRWMFDPTFSVINWIIQYGLHLNRVDWLGTPFTAMLAMMVVNSWRGIPFYGIAFLAGLQTIPTDLYEAARVDGANRWQQFLHITMPMLRPVLLVVLLLSTILTFADFQVPWVLTRGAPYNSTHLLATWAYTVAIPGSELGLGASISLFLFPILTLVVATVLVTIRRQD
ncbi:MAG: sugar ABC transporter permease [Chloroflexota bacterium]